MIIDIESLGWTEWAAIIGATTGIVALTIQFFQYIHLKPKLRIDITPECFVLRNEFKNQDKDDPNAGAYNPATYIVITNIGQMTATILRFEIRCRNYFLDWYLIKKLYHFVKKSTIIMSYSEGVIVDQTRKVPTTIESGHSWLAILDVKLFRDRLDRFPYVFLELKAAHKTKPIRKRIKIKPWNKKDTAQGIIAKKN